MGDPCLMGEVEMAFRQSRGQQPTRRPRKPPYPDVAAWGRHLGSRDFYIEKQVAQAVVDGAPMDAIFKDSDGVWHTMADLRRQPPEAAG